MTEKKVILGIICCSYLVRLYNLLTAAAIDIDGIDYAAGARCFAVGAFEAALNCVRVPFYSFVTGSFHLIIPDVELAGRVVSLVFSILLVLLVYLFCRRHLGDKLALRAAALAAIHPLLIEYSTRMLSESLATFLFAGAVFAFYQGQQDGNRKWMAYSGMLLTFAYLTRPEYIIYFVPLTLFLVFSREKKKGSTLALFLVPFLFLGCLFIVYVRLETGFWVIDKKMLQWEPEASHALNTFSLFFGDVSPLEAIRNVPLVVWNFCSALVVPFLLLTLLGIRQTDRKYLLLLLVLVCAHIIGRSFVSHSTERYSVEFIPLTFIPAALATVRVEAFFSKRRYGEKVVAALVCTAFLFSLAAGLSRHSHGRQLHKETGLLIKRCTDQGAIASRLPIAAFYANRPWVDLETPAETRGTCETIRRFMKEQHVRFVVIDDRLARENAVILSCLTHLTLLTRKADKQGYVQAYRVEGE